MRTGVVIVAALSTIAFSAVVRQPMFKTASLRQKLSKLAKTGPIKERVLRNSLLTSNAKSSSQTIFDDLDTFYLVNITLGSPPQTFTVELDTGSSDLWVIDAACKTQACKGLPNAIDDYKKKLFDPSQSTTFKNTSQLFGCSGECRGYVGTDVISIAGLTYDAQSFGVASTVSPIDGDYPYDGVLGLAWPAVAYIVGAKPVMQNLLPQLDLPLFTIWLDRHAKPAENAPGGQITYGGLDPVNCDARVNWVGLSHKTLWQFPIEKFTVPGYATTRAQQVISDTGTSFIQAPPAAFKGIIAALSAKKDRNGDYEVPCKGNYPDLIFSIAGIDYSIPPSEYLLELDDATGKQCTLAVFEGDPGAGFNHDWALGDPWIRTYCQIYDIGNARIGFAKAHHSEV